MKADAGILYDAGTTALGRGQIGEATAFLLAARRIEPRAADIRRNLAIAERTVASLRGDAPAAMPRGPAFAVSAAEGWWIAALLVAIGAACGIAAIVRGQRNAKPNAESSPGRNTTRWLRRVSIGSTIVGMLGAGWLTTRAVAERHHPESVVVALSVEARRGVDEAPRAPILLRAGERVRAGRTHGDDVEVFIGESPIGWVPRAALWNVADAPRYTAGFHSR